MPSSQSRMNAELAALVSAAHAGESIAWTRLVDRFDHMLRSVASSYRLSSHDVDDAVQATWVKLYEHIGRLREPEAIAGWLCTTVRRECLRLLQRHVRELLTDETDFPGPDDTRSPEAMVLAGEQRVMLARALASLPDRHRRLMTLLVSEQGPDYRQISAALDMPVGSIGPIRARSLARLQRHPELRAVAGRA